MVGERPFNMLCPALGLSVGSAGFHLLRSSRTVGHRPGQYLFSYARAILRQGTLSFIRTWPSSMPQHNDFCQLETITISGSRLRIDYGEGVLRVTSAKSDRLTVEWWFNAAFTKTRTECNSRLYRREMCWLLHVNSTCTSLRPLPDESLEADWT